MQTIVLNAGYEPIQIISWQRALLLILTEKAELVAGHHERTVRSVSRTFPLPSIVRLKTYIKGLGRLVGISRYNRRNVFLRDRFRCQYCGVSCNHKTATIDHVLPRCRGGLNSFENTVVSCSPCNNSKSDKTPEEAGMKLLRRPKRPDWRELLTDYSLLALTEAFDYPEPGDDDL